MAALSNERIAELREQWSKDAHWARSPADRELAESLVTLADEVLADRAKPPPRHTVVRVLTTDGDSVEHLVEGEVTEVIVYTEALVPLARLVLR